VTGVTRGHPQCHHSIEHISLPIHLSDKLYVSLVPFSRYSELFCQNSKIFSTHV